MYAIGLGNGSARVALGQPVQRLGLLMFGELWLTSHVSSVGARRHASLARSLVNANALVFGHGAQECDEAPANGRRQIEMRLSRTLISAPRAWTRSTMAMPSIMVRVALIPFGDHEDVAFAELVDGFFELWPLLGILAGGLLAKDFRASFRPKCTELAF